MSRNANRRGTSIFLLKLAIFAEVAEYEIPDEMLDLLREHGEKITTILGNEPMDLKHFAVLSTNIMLNAVQDIVSQTLGPIHAAPITEQIARITGLHLATCELSLSPKGPTREGSADEAVSS